MEDYDFDPHAPAHEHVHVGNDSCHGTETFSTLITIQTDEAKVAYRASTYLRPWVHYFATLQNNSCSLTGHLQPPAHGM